MPPKSEIGITSKKKNTCDPIIFFYTITKFSLYYLNEIISNMVSQIRRRPAPYFMFRYLDLDEITERK